MSVIVKPHAGRPCIGVGSKGYQKKIMIYPTKISVFLTRYIVLDVRKITE